MDIAKYLTRININYLPSPNLKNLFLLQKNHLLNIPFENLDIHIGRKIEIDYDKIFQKIVVEKRGGFCHELNGLFYFLLQNLGFRVKRISAQVYGSQNVFGKPFDHVAIIVKVDQKDWLVDVGFGKFSFQPLEIELGKIQTDGNDFFKIEKLNYRYHVVLTQTENKEWKYGYKFTRNHKESTQFESMCHWQQTSPDSNFTKRKMITIPTKDYGRVTLTDHELIKTKKGKVIKTLVKSEEDFYKKLEKHFKIKL